MSGLCSESDPTRWDKDSEMGSKGMSSDTKDSFLASVASNHSSKIGLMQNLQTGSISPQFHVVFDELFLTAHSVDEDNGTWIELFTSECDYFEPDKKKRKMMESYSLKSIPPGYRSQSCCSFRPFLSLPNASQIIPDTPIIAPPDAILVPDPPLDVATIHLTRRSNINPTLNKIHPSVAVEQGVPIDAFLETSGLTMILSN